MQQAGSASLPVVIIGGGFAGLRVAQRLSRAGRAFSREIVLIDRHEHHVYTPVLYELAGGTAPSAHMETRMLHSVTFRYTNILAGMPGVRFVHDTVTAVDRKKKTVSLASGGVQPYHQLVLALGSESEYYGIPGLAEHAQIMRSRDDALVIHRRVDQFVKAKRAGKEVEFRLVIGGGGATGVELTAELAGGFHRLEKEGTIARGDWSLTIVQAAARLVPAIPPAASEEIKKRLEDLGVIVHVDTCVKRVEDAHVVLAPRPLVKGETTENLVCSFRAEFEKKFDYDFLIWVGGVRGPAALGAWGFSVNGKGCVPVSGDMRVVGESDVFAIGDCAGIQNPVTKEVAPWLAQSAIVEATVAVSQILADAGCPVPRKTYVFRSYPAVLPLGNRRAIAVFDSFTLDGLPGWIVRQFADAQYLFSLLPFGMALRAFLRKSS